LIPDEVLGNPIEWHELEEVLRKDLNWSLWCVGITNGKWVSNNAVNEAGLLLMPNPPAYSILPMVAEGRSGRTTELEYA
jgi:hypothetical protein